MKIKLSPKLDLLACLEFEVNAATQENQLRRVINYIKGPRYLVNNITDEEAKPNDTKTRFNQMFELPREDNLLFGVIRKEINTKRNFLKE